MTDVPILGELPLSMKPEKGAIVVQENQNGTMEEAFRGLRTNMLFMLAASQKVVLFTATQPGEGKSFIAGNTAVSLAYMGKKAVSYTHLTSTLNSFIRFMDGKDIPLGDTDSDLMTAYETWLKSKDTVSYTHLDVYKRQQHDILYGRASVTRDIPTADIEMRHAMSLVRIKILKNEYMGEGIVSNLSLIHIYKGSPS